MTEAKLQQEKTGRTDTAWHNSQHLLLLRKEFSPKSMLLRDGSINQELWPLPFLFLSPQLQTNVHKHACANSYFQPKELSSKWSDVEYLCLVEGIKEFGVGGMNSWIKISEKWLPQRDFTEIKLRIWQKPQTRQWHYLRGATSLWAHLELAESQLLPIGSWWELDKEKSPYLKLSENKTYQFMKITSLRANWTLNVNIKGIKN